jgi:hypothetical protein
MERIENTDKNRMKQVSFWFCGKVIVSNPKIISLTTPYRGRYSPKRALVEKRMSTTNDKSVVRVSSGSPHNHGSSIGILLIIMLLVVTLAASMYKGQSIYIFGYIMAIVYAISRVTRHGRPVQELGIKRGFVKDFRRVWYFFGIDAVLFQLLPPTLGIAFVFGQSMPC